jgi:hypothetical protein
MIIGSAEALVELGIQLQTAPRFRQMSAFPNGPLRSQGLGSWVPTLDDPHFQLSFHVQRRAELPSWLRLHRRRLQRIMNLAFFALALLGAATIVTWLLAL